MKRLAILLILLFLTISSLHAETVLFDEHFGGKLRDGWSWIREVPERHRFKDGSLEIRMEPNPDGGIRNILVRKTPKKDDGPFIVQLEVDSDKPFSNQFQQVGIYWLRGEDVKFKLVKEFINGNSYVFPGKKPLDKQRVTLRLVIDGTKATGHFKPEGAVEFQQACEATLPERNDEEDRIAVQCWHGPADSECWTKLKRFQIIRPTMPGERTISLTFLGPDGKPIPGAEALAWSNPKPKNWFNRRFEIKADAEGKASIPFLPADNMQTFTINVDTPGFTKYFAKWQDPKNDPIPDSLTFTLDRGGIVGGTVTDDAGKPLSGVKVGFHYPLGDRQRIKSESVTSSEATTDTNGRWKVDTVSPEFLANRVSITLEHPDFKKTEKNAVLSTLRPNESGEFTETMTMERGLDVVGTVVDGQGKPIAGATVYGSAGSRNHDYQKATTDENGRFAFKNWPESKTEHLIARADGFAPELFDRLEIRTGMEPVSITLKPGKTLRARVVNRDGRPVPNVWFAVERWRTQRLVSEAAMGGRKNTDADGRIVIENAPEDEILFDLLPSGGDASVYRTLRKQSATAGNPEYTFTLEPALKISGKVFDAETKKPIPAFKIFKGFRFPGQNRLYWDDYRTSSGRDGVFETVYSDESRDFLLKIEAEGYAPKLSDEISLSKDRVELEFALEKATGEAAQGISGQILNIDGKPVQRATVALAMKDRSPYIQNGSLSSNSSILSATTDEQGRFTLPPIAAEELEAIAGGKTDDMPDYRLFVLHPSGYANVKKEEFEKNENSISLEKWARIEGTVHIGTKPGKDVSLNLNLRDDERDWSKPRAWFDYRSTSDAEGKFVFEQVPPGKGTVIKEIKFGGRDGGYMSTGSHGEKVELKAGETVTVKVGGVGRPVVGKLTLPENFEAETDWNYSVVRLRPSMGEQEKFPKMEELQKTQETFPENMKTETDLEIRKKLFEEWKETEDGKRYAALADEYNEWANKNNEKQQESYAKGRAGAVDRNGNFRIDDIPPGVWSLEVQLDEPPPEGQCGGGERLGELNKEITVPNFDGAVTDEVFELGTLTVAKAKRRPKLIAVGAEAPDFELKRLVPKKDGEEEPEEEIVKLSNYRGKTVVLEFWATWCGPCLAKLPEINRLYTEKIKDDPKSELIGMSIDNDDKTVLNFLSKRQPNDEMLWLQLRTDPSGSVCNDYGVFAVPAMVVVGPDGKVVAVNPDNASLEKWLKGKGP